jgi:hypothetical protein
MRRIKKIIGAERLMPIIKEVVGGSTVIKTSHNLNKPRPFKLNQTDRLQLNNNEHLQKRQPRPISKIDPIWEGETIYIVGGGPSLLNFNWNSLAGKKTIAINKAILSLPSANVLYWTDSIVYGWYKSEIDKFKGLKITIRDNPSYPNDVKILKKGEKYGLGEDGSTLSHGNNSGYAAINLAYLLGAKKIVLLGYDMKNNGVQGHYHDGYPVPLTGDSVYKEQFIPGFVILANLLKEKGVEVYNASIESSITVWPKITHETALSL